MKLYQGNCLQILPTLDISVDAVITDPPYCSGAASLSGKQAPTNVKYQHGSSKAVYPAFIGDAKDQRSFIRWSTEWLIECWRLAKDGAPLLVFSDWRQLPALVDAVQMADWHWRGIVIWNKPSGRPILGEFRRDSEFLIYATKGKRTPCNKKCLPGTYSHTVSPKERYHITSKPVSLMCDLLEIVPPGGLVLDPFIGSGTTAVACAKTGRDCVGIELSEEYRQIALQRLAGGEYA